MNTEVTEMKRRVSDLLYSEYDASISDIRMLCNYIEQAYQLGWKDCEKDAIDELCE